LVYTVVANAKPSRLSSFLGCSFAGNCLNKSLQSAYLPFKSIFSVLSNSRMMYAFARDGGFPGHSFFHYVHPTTHVPVRTGKSQTRNAFNLELIVCSMACLHAELYLGVAKFCKCRRIYSRNEHHYSWIIHLLRCVGSLDVNCMIPCSSFNRNSDCPPSSKRCRFHERSLPSGKIFLPRGDHRNYLDLLYLYRLHSTSGQRTPILSSLIDILLT
jgi:hypothetical protein